MARATHDALIDDERVVVNRFAFGPGDETGHHVHGMAYVIAAAAVALCLSPASHASACLIEDLPAPNATQNYEATMRALMIAHAPIEYRKSCGLRDNSDLLFFNAIRTGAGCNGSAAYDQFFGGFLNDQSAYLMAVDRTDLRTDEDFETYCAIIARIDLDIAVTPEGTIDAEALRTQGPLFGAIQNLIETRRWQQ